MKLNFVGIGIILLVIGVITFSGCTQIPEFTNNIIIQNSTFNPNEMNVREGTMVYWVNNDSIPHKVVSDTGAFESKILNPGDDFHHTFNEEGVYNYHDAMNSSMTGKIIVRNPKRI